MSQIIDFAAAKLARQQAEEKTQPELKNCMAVFQYYQDKYRLHNYQWQSLLMKLVVKLEKENKLTCDEFLKHVQESAPQTPEAS